MRLSTTVAPGMHLVAGVWKVMFLTMELPVSKLISSCVAKGGKSIGNKKRLVVKHRFRF